MTQRNETILRAVRESAKIVLSAPRGCPADKIHEKDGTFNYVTEYDVAVQRYLETELIKIVPDARFLAEEEDGDLRGPGEGYTFIIDPIDGTSNFIHGFGVSAISVALFRDGEPEFGAVCLPFSGETFYAEAGGGAYLDGRQIRVSDLPMERSLTLFGTTPYMRDTMCDAVLELMRGLFVSSVDVRRCGAAAADLCFVACGRASAFCEMLLSPWDIAAGALIVSEAGGIVSDFCGGGLRYDSKCSIIAANEQSYGKALAVCRALSDKYGV
ncbi:MAG: inositol monophosphatase [Clostridia bacterium]|nr:inositol monophosphatase [Clostridia bacterium]